MTATTAFPPGTRVDYFSKSGAWLTGTITDAIEVGRHGGFIHTVTLDNGDQRAAPSAMLREAH